MSEIPEGATHKHSGDFYKKKGEVWFWFNDALSHWSDGTDANNGTGWAKKHLTPIKQDKEMNIDWNSKDAEGCDWALYCKEVDIVNFYTFEPSHGGERWHCESTVFDGYPSYPHYKLHTRPKAEEMIYTKQMHEAGECPRLGMSFTFKGGSNDYIAKVIGLAIGSDHIQVVTFEYTDKTGLSGVECAFFDKSVFHSIDTRTEAEKNEEEVIKYMNDFVSTITSNRHPIDQIDVDEQNIAIFNQIKTGKIPHITFTGDK